MAHEIFGMTVIYMSKVVGMNGLLDVYSALYRYLPHDIFSMYVLLPALQYNHPTSPSTCQDLNGLREISRPFILTDATVALPATIYST